MRVEKWLPSFAKKATSKGDSGKLLLDAHEPSWLCALSLHRAPLPFTLTAFPSGTFCLSENWLPPPVLFPVFFPCFLLPQTHSTKQVFKELG